MYSFELKFIISLLVYSTLFINKSVAECTVNGSEYVCSSVSDINQGQPKPEWTSVKVLSTSKQQIVENGLTNIPNVNTLIFDGAVNKIIRHSFKGLSKLNRLHFLNNDLKTLEPFVFEYLPVAELIIYSSNVQTLKARCLDNLPNLKYVYTHNNSISTIPAGVFSHTNIEILVLNLNKISTIENEAFYGMKNLRRLALERNFLHTFNAHALVGNTSPNLYLLWLAHNNITRMTSDMLSPFPQMKVLLMHFNHIDTIEDGTFDGLNELRYIDISNNNLQELSPLVFPKNGLEFLDILFLQNNRFIFLSPDVIDKFPKLTKIAIGGNPWLCPCYQDLKTALSEKDVVLACDDEYLTGKRPVCVSAEVNTDKNKCEPSKESASSLYNFYHSAQSEYKSLPPLCKISCGDKSCYSHSFDVLDY